MKKIKGGKSCVDKIAIAGAAYTTTYLLMMQKLDKLQSIRKLFSI